MELMADGAGTGAPPLDELPDGVLVLDAAGAVIAMSVPARRLLGLDLGPDLGGTVTGAGGPSAAGTAFVDADGRALHADELPPTVAVRTGVPSREVLVGVGPPSRRRWVSFSTELRTGPGGEPAGALATVRSAAGVKWNRDLRVAVRRLAVRLTAGPPESLVDDLLATMGTAVGADRVLVVNLDRDAGRIHATHDWSSNGRPWERLAGGLPVDLVAGLLRRLVKGRPLVVPHLREIVAHDDLADRFAQWGMVTSVFVPLVVEDQLDGFLLFGWDDVHDPAAEVVAFTADAGELVAAHRARVRGEGDPDAVRRERADELALAHHRARLFVDVMPDLFVRVDAEDRLVDYYVPRTDLPTDLLDDILGGSVIDVLAPARGEELRRVLQRARDTGAPQLMDFEWVTGDHVRVFESRYLADVDDTVISIVREVTGVVERDQLAREQAVALAAANAELQRLVQERDEFLAGVSHELRTPLNAILGLTEMLLEDEGDPVSAGQRATLRTIESSGRHLLILINDLLDLSRLRAGVLDLRLAEVAVKDPCRLALDLVRARADQKGLTAELVIAADDVVIVADERRLRQVLINLLDNAVKFTDPGGSVGLRVWSPDAEHVALTVWDTGVGIAAPDQPRAFQPFTQLDGRRRNAVWRGPDRRSGGSGLGLALVERLVTLHDGHIELDSAPGRGSRFTVVLPVAGPAGGAPVVDRSGFDVGRSSPRIPDLRIALR